MKVEFVETRKIRDRVGEGRQFVVGGAKLDEAGHGTNGFGEESEAVFVDVEVAEADELCEGQRE